MTTSQKQFLELTTDYYNYTLGNLEITEKFNISTSVLNAKIIEKLYNKMI